MSNDLLFTEQHQANGQNFSAGSTELYPYVKFVEDGTVSLPFEVTGSRSREAAEGTQSAALGCPADRWVRRRGDLAVLHLIVESTRHFGASSPYQ